MQASTRDTLICPVMITRWAFDNVCARSAFENGAVSILPVSVSGMEQPIGPERMAVFPEPSQGRFTVRVSSAVPSPMTLRVRDLLGRLVHESQYEAVQGDRSFDLDLGNAPEGVYLIETHIGSARVVRRATLLR